MPREWLIQHRAGTLAEWAAAEASGPVLLAGERAYITDLNLDVVGDGVTKVASLGAVGSDTYARLSGPLGGWRAKLASDPANAKVVFVGDSTSDAATAAGEMYRRLMVLHTQQGEALSGLAPQDAYTDGVGNGTTTFTSASAAFTSADVGRFVHGKSFPLSTVITAVNSATSVTLGASIPAGTSLPFWVGRHIANGGNNGMTLQQWFAEPAGVFPYNRNRLAAESPDLTVYSWLLNDIRQGAMGLTEAAIVPVGIARMQALIDWHRANVSGDILLRMPNTILTANVSGLNFLTDGTTVNPAGLAQIYTNALRRIYLYFAGRYPNVDVLDVQGEVFGTRSTASHPLNADQLHPSVHTINDASTLVVAGGGYCAIADALAKRIGNTRNAFVPDGAQRVRHEFIVSDGPSANTIRLISRDPYGLPAPQAPVFKSDSLYINGVDSPIALTAAVVDRVFSATVLQLTSLTGDWSPYIGRTAVIAGAHAPQSTGDRQQVYIDLPSIAAGATVTQTASVTGLAPGHNGNAAAVVANPGGTFGSSGLLLLGAYPSSDSTVKLVIQNPTGSAVDLAGESWTFWVLR